MATQSNQSVIDDFLARHHSNFRNEALVSALRLTPNIMEAFWAILRSIDEDTGLMIPDILGVLEGVVKSPSNYVLELKKRGYIESKERGKWSLTDRAIKRMSAVLKGEATEEETKTSRTTKRRRKKSSKKTGTRKSAKISKPRRKKQKPRESKGSGVETMTLAQIKDRVMEIDKQMADLQDERAELVNGAKSAVKAL